MATPGVSGGRPRTVNVSRESDDLRDILQLTNTIGSILFGAADLGLRFSNAKTAQAQRDIANKLAERKQKFTEDQAVRADELANLSAAIEQDRFAAERQEADREFEFREGVEQAAEQRRAADEVRRQKQEARSARFEEAKIRQLEARVNLLSDPVDKRVQSIIDSLLDPEFQRTAEEIANEAIKLGVDQDLIRALRGRGEVVALINAKNAAITTEAGPVQQQGPPASATSAAPQAAAPRPQVPLGGADERLFQQGMALQSGEFRPRVPGGLAGRNVASPEDQERALMQQGAARLIDLQRRIASGELSTDPRRIRGRNLPSMLELEQGKEAALQEAFPFGRVVSPTQDQQQLAQSAMQAFTFPNFPLPIP